jgi:hypothetical protein
MFGNAVLQGEGLFQPPFFGFPVSFDGFPPFGESHGGQQGNNDNFYQGIRFVPFDAGVFGILEEAE